MSKKKFLPVATLMGGALLTMLASCSMITDGESEEELEASRSAVAANYETYTTAAEICEVCYLGYNEGVYGPITVQQGTLTESGATKAIYLITLSGTETVINQSTGYLTDLLVGFNQNNAYLTNVVAVITNNIPSNSNLVLAGHSLGGMVAQQVAANTSIKNNYNVLHTVTFGSPLLCATSREGVVKRLGDTSDVVPYLSATGSVSQEVWKIIGLQRENGGYGLNAYKAHTESYLRSDEWGKYDAVGVKNGSATLKINVDTLTYYHSPTNY